MEIKTDNYCVSYSEETFTFSIRGSLRLSGMSDYAPIVDLLDQVTNQAPAIIILDLEKLEFLNSSGISMLSKFVINVRKKQQTMIVIKGSKTIPWQGKSLKNLQRLMPTLTLELN